MTLSSLLSLKANSRYARIRIARNTIAIKDLLQIFVKPSIKKSKVGLDSHDPWLFIKEILLNITHIPGIKSNNNIMLFLKMASIILS